MMPLHLHVNQKSDYDDDDDDDSVYETGSPVLHLFQVVNVKFYPYYSGKISLG